MQIGSNRPDKLRLVCDGHYMFMSEDDFINNKDLFNLEMLFKQIPEKDIPEWAFKYIPVI